MAQGPVASAVASSQTNPAGLRGHVVPACPHPLVTGGEKPMTPSVGDARDTPCLPEATAAARVLGEVVVRVYAPVPRPPSLPR